LSLAASLTCRPGQTSSFRDILSRVNATQPSGECGVEGSVYERIENCHLETPEADGSVFQMVSRVKSYKSLNQHFEVWKDTKSGLIWSAYPNFLFHDHEINSFGDPCEKAASSGHQGPLVGANVDKLASVRRTQANIDGKWRLPTEEQVKDLFSRLEPKPSQFHLGPSTLRLPTGIPYWTQKESKILPFSPDRMSTFNNKPPVVVCVLEQTVVARQEGVRKSFL